MKRIFIFVFALSVAVTLSAQSIVRSGFYIQDGTPVISNPESSVSLTITVEKSTFKPGVFARYAQKLLGVRASLAERTETKLSSVKLLAQEPATPPVSTISGGVEEVILPAFRIDNRAMTLEQQAEAAAELIFSLRRHRKELIMGEVGENVFGAGLAAALSQMDAMEQQCLTMFYGTTVTEVKESRFTIVPTSSEKNYIVCRYRENDGVLPLSDLSGEPVMVTFTPSKVNLLSLPVATDKDKVTSEYLIAADCKVELFMGTSSVATLDLPIFQYGKKVVLAVK